MFNSKNQDFCVIDAGRNIIKQYNCLNVCNWRTDWHLTSCTDNIIRSKLQTLTSIFQDVKTCDDQTNKKI